MSQKYPYLSDSAFLKQFDKLRIKEQFVKINVLSFEDERILTSIQGDVLSGNISIDGSSAIRRTANISVLVKNDKYSTQDIKKILTINKKIEIQIGFKNITKKFTKYPILWFPQGIYVIIAPNITHNNNGTTITLTLHDKMAT